MGTTVVWPAIIAAISGRRRYLALCCMQSRTTSTLTPSLCANLCMLPWVAIKLALLAQRAMMVSAVSLFDGPAVTLAD